MSLTNVTITPVKNVLGSLWLGIAVIIVAILAMWVCNIAEMKWAVIIITVVGSFLIAIVGYRATNVVSFGIFGGIMSALQDRDKSQGAATGLIWLTNIIIALAMTFILAGFTLMTWSFKQAPGAFWVLFLATVLIILAQQVFKIEKTKTAWNLIRGYAVLCSIVAIWTTFGGAYTGNSFDANTGEPRYMIDPVTKNIDAERRTPADCRPTVTVNNELRRYAHIDNEGGVFNYAKDGTCFSLETGRKLVPMLEDGAQRRNPASWGAVIIGGFTELFGMSKEAPTWLWVVVCLAAVVVAWKFFARRRAASPNALESADWVGIGIITFVAVGLTTAVLAIVFEFTSLDEKVMTVIGKGNPQVASHNDCMLAKDLDLYTRKVSEAKKCITVVNGDEPFNLTSFSSDYRLKVTIFGPEKERYKEVFGKFTSADEFVDLTPRQAQSYEVVLNPFGFSKYGLKEGTRLTLVFEAVPM